MPPLPSLRTRRVPVAGSGDTPLDTCSCRLVVSWVSVAPGKSAITSAAATESAAGVVEGPPTM